MLTIKTLLFNKLFKHNKSFFFTNLIRGLVLALKIKIRQRKEKRGALPFHRPLTTRRKVTCRHLLF